MTDIIELLFDNECENECGYHVKKEELEKDEEYQAYQKVCALLNEEGREIFDRFEELYSERYSEKTERYYRLGFETGFSFALELLCSRDKR